MVTELRALQPGVNDFELCAVVGRGHFAEVRVVREKTTGDVCALKVMDKAVLRNQANVRPTFDSAVLLRHTSLIFNIILFVCTYFSAKQYFPFELDSNCKRNLNIKVQ